MSSDASPATAAGDQLGDVRFFEAGRDLVVTSTSLFADRAAILVVYSFLAVVIRLIPGTVDAAEPASERASVAPQSGQPTLERGLSNDIQPLLRRYCFECHSGEVTEADIDLAKFSGIADCRLDTETWIKVRRIVAEGQMPPPDAPQPTVEERARLESWVRRFLRGEAESRAGDPGPVPLRRLSNAEYAYSIIDLTGVDSLDPGREFPIDGAAGEGFTNTGGGQGMSPALAQKYLDAAKEVAEHLVLLPNGIGFSPFTSRRDRTNALLARVQEFYSRYTADGGGERVNLQGIVFDTNQGGLLPVERYLRTLFAARDQLRAKSVSLEHLAHEHRLSQRYLTALWLTLEVDGGAENDLLLSSLRAHWRSDDANAVERMVAEIAAWQRVLFRFNSVGHIGRAGGPERWLDPVSHVAERVELRRELPSTGDPVRVSLVARGARRGAGTEVIWERPRLEFAAESGLPPLPLRDVRAASERARSLIAAELPRTADYLAAVAEAHSAAASADQIATIAANRGLNAALLNRWIRFVGLNEPASREVRGLYTARLTKVADYEAVNGWGSHQTPSLVTNSAAAEIRYSTLSVPGRGVLVHPAPTLESFVVWRSPVDTRVAITGRVVDRDPNCGNGVAWRIEHRSAAGRATLASGTLDNAGKQVLDLAARPVDVAAGDLLLLVINAREGSHVCDSTEIEWTLTESGDAARTWVLSEQIVDHVLESNPLADTFGNPDVWAWGALETVATENRDAVPADAAIAAWREAVRLRQSPAEIAQRVAAFTQTLAAADNTPANPSDASVRERLLDWQGPLGWLALAIDTPTSEDVAIRSASDDRFGLAADQFGRSHSQAEIDPLDVATLAPLRLTFELPPELARNATFVSGGRMVAGPAATTPVQLEVALEAAGDVTEAADLVAGAEFIAPAHSEAAKVVGTSFAAFRELFPPALCYARIVPVDEVVTLQLYYREDDQLQRVMLEEAERLELDALWDELLFVAQEPLALEVAFEQLSEFATQDRPDLVKAFEPARTRVVERARAFEARLGSLEPMQLASVCDWAARAWRHPLTDEQRGGLVSLYDSLRASGIEHEPALRLLVARVLTAPDFLYKLERPSEGTGSAPVDGFELATRLSYFLWSSTPDEALWRAAADGSLLTDEGLRAQTRRMLQDAKVRRMAIHFVCQWLHLRDFDRNDDKNERLFPEFASLRGDMYEETVRYCERLIRDDRPVLELIDSDYTFLNEALARHYGVADVVGTPWRRVDGVARQGRGGVLGMASFLASQSGASRTSPILRGNWVYETLLGERLPRPPAGVPQLPEELPAGLTARELIEQHSSRAACAHCHVRID
ncbi:MAG: DUF1592 domain-containing protein, partial [Planctomycetaceae bacterium]